MGKTDYISPLPIKNLIERYSEAFNKLAHGHSTTVVSIPHFGHTSHMRYISSSPEVLSKLGLKNSKFVFIDRDKVSDKYESFVSELLQNMSNKDFSNIIFSQNAYLLNSEAIKITKEITKVKSLVISIVLEKNLTNYIPEIENLFLLMQKSTEKFPISILWICDTKVIRNHKHTHPSSTFLTNLTYQKNFDQKETEYCLQRISNLKGQKVSRDILKKSLELTGGFACTFHQLINFGELKTSDYVKSSLKDIKNEIELNSKTKNKLVTKEGLSFLNGLEITEIEFESIKLSKNPTAQEINIIRFLQKNIEKPVTRDQIAQALWGKSWNSKYSDWAIDKAISRLRKNIVSPNLKIITVKNLGYQLIKL